MAVEVVNPQDTTTVIKSDGTTTKPIKILLKDATTTTTTTQAGRVATAEVVQPTDETTTNPCEDIADPIEKMLCLVIQGLIAVVDGFVTVLQQNAQTLAELTIVGGLIYGSLKLFGSAFRNLRAITGLRA